MGLIIFTLLYMLSYVFHFMHFNHLSNLFLLSQSQIHERKTLRMLGQVQAAVFLVNLRGFLPPPVSFGSFRKLPPLAVSTRVLPEKLIFRCRRLPRPLRVVVLGDATEV